jgi:hypothetical protein
MEMTTGDDDDLDLLKSYRSASCEMPDAALDHQILAAASAFRARRRQFPFLLAAAACLLIALYASLPKSSHTPVGPLDPRLAQAGLNEGRTAQFLSSPEATQRTALQQIPGGTD